jgi:hypothetical protein
MAHAETTIVADLGPMRLGAPGSRMIAAGLVLAAVGFGAACALGLADPPSQKIFWHAYLVSFTFFLSITLGALFFVMLHHLSRAGWSVTVRRLSEGLSGNVALMALLFLGLLPGLGTLYEWAHPGAAARLGILPDKAAYLSPAAFVLRFAVYFAVWGGLTWLLRRRSIAQDATGDVGLTLAMERLSGPGMVAFGFTATFAAFDLLMSLNPHWTSTIFGVYFFSGSFLSFLVVLTLLALWLQRNGCLVSEITPEHYHDLGKLTFAFVVFWGYIAVSQYLLIWYANLPEETQFYMSRQIGPWAAVSLALAACHLLIPLFGLLSRHAKRHRGVFTFWAVWLLAAHLFDLFWLVMPNLFISEIPQAVGAPAGSPLPRMLKELLASNQSVYQVADHHAGFVQALYLPLEPRSLAVLLGLVVGMGGLYLASTAWLLRRAALVPLADPRLAEAMSFENT